MALPFNQIFPPDFKKYGKKYNGYKNSNTEIVLYDFATLGYDLELHYKGKTYYFQQHTEGVCQCLGLNEKGKPCSPYGEYFKDANDLIKNFVLDDGKHICEILNDLEFAEPW